jgi:D-xylose 1-dehydrogenase (NADP+, D-xylono-1,5-lactone-forming)
VSGRWGFLGAGHIATANLAPAVRCTPGARLHAVAATDATRAAALGADRVYRDYADLLADHTVDIVYVALHNAVHAHWVIEALHAGKHVLCEKPLGLTAAEVAAMGAAARTADRLLMEAAWHWWHPRSVDWVDSVRRGDIGRVVHVDAAFDGAVPGAGNFRRAAALGGGALLDLGCYAVGAALAAYDWSVPEVAEVHTNRWPDGHADERTDVRLRFDSGTADVSVSLRGNGTERLVITGDMGRITLRGAPFTAGATPVALSVTGPDSADTRHYPAIDPYQLMVADMTRAAAGDLSGYLVPLVRTRIVASVLDAVHAAR